MNILPAIDLFDKKAVRLYKGDYNEMTVYSDNPLEVARDFERSYEYGTHEGLSLLKGEIVGMDGRIPEKMKIPHIGWNALHIKAEHPIFKYVEDGDHVYFVHSYYGANCEDSVIAYTEYGANLTAAVANKNVCGCQFHPEKSGEVGLSILKAFCEI